MSKKRCLVVVVLAVISGFAASAAVGAIGISTVPIGNPGNAADPSTGYGSAAYRYNIGAAEVTNAQYAAFLNAVAQADANGLYNANMGGSLGGISRSGASGSFSYAVLSGRANNPVNYVSFWDAARFANWLHNGQPTGAQSASTTEDGAYTLTAGGISGNSVTRNAGWQWAVGSSSEWYKAAYHQPASLGGDSDNYWLYPTSSNSLPTTAQGNFNNAIGNTTPVGSYAANYYGAFDMGGNVWEWNDTIAGSLATRGVRGGSFAFGDSNLRSDVQLTLFPTNETNYIGFRVVELPGPSSMAVLGIGVALAARRRRG